MSMRTGERPRLVASLIMQGEARNTASTSARDAAQSSVHRDFALTQMDYSLDQISGITMGNDQNDVDWALQQVTQQTAAATPGFGLAPEHNDATNANNTFMPPCDLLPTPFIQDFSLDSLNQDDGRQPLERLKSTHHFSDNEDSRRSSSVDSKAFLPNKGHDCTIEALILVADSHVLATDCLTAAKDPMCPLNLACCTGNTKREIGTVLSDNQKAIKGLDSLLDCSCSTRQEILVLICLAFSKAVVWYAAVLDSDENDDDDDKWSHDEGNSATPQALQHTARIHCFLGSQSLDKNTQRLISAHIVLTQLKDHVYPFLKRLRHSHLSAMATVTNDTPKLSTSNRRTSSVIEYYYLALTEKLGRISARAESIKQLC
ncbi:zinc finger transcription factor [Colletotrichum eremochloae]|nr:zinc finger transcription factor [Colletotrichum eremochloae]